MSTSSLRSLPARVRRFTARHRWTGVVTPLVIGIGTFSAVDRLDDAADDARAGWGEAAPVWIAAAPAGPGEPVVAERRDVPAWLVPDGAADPHRDLSIATARRSVAAGAIITAADIDDRPAPLALVPPGWLVVAIVESPAVGAAVGERVQVVADGIVLAEDATVVEAVDGRTLVAMPAEAAPMTAFAVSQGGVSLLRSGG